MTPSQDQNGQPDEKLALSENLRFDHTLGLLIVLVVMVVMMGLSEAVAPARSSLDRPPA